MRGRELLRNAPVIVYDQLVNPALLNEAGSQTIKVFVGKRAGRHCIAQEEINSVLMAHARAGRDVVRLKGGDPFVFGRGGEEAEALVEAGIPFEIVPGVSSAVAVPAYAPAFRSPIGSSPRPSPWSPAMKRARQIPP